MRYLRWKRNYFSGFPTLDNPKQALFEDIQTIQTEMVEREHCQDMEDLMHELQAQARSLFEAKAGGREEAEGLVHIHAEAIQQTLDRHLPLAALDTPACRDCDVCARTERMLREWRAHTETLQEDEKDAAA